MKLIIDLNSASHRSILAISYNRFTASPPKNSADC